jgi:hypothetical protein
MNQAADKRAFGKALAGFRIGILVLETTHDLVRGNIQHAGSFDFPVLYEIVRGVSATALMSGDPEAAAPIVAGAQHLEQSGADVIVGACGSFANYQNAVTAAANVPVFMSILLEVPFLLKAMPPSRQLGILFANSKSFTARVRDQCGITEPDRIVVVGAETVDAFQPILKQQGRLDSESLGRSIASLAERTQAEHPGIGAWLLQCSDLPPYAALIQEATQRPVFDMLTLIAHAHQACERRSWCPTGNRCA